MAFIAAASASVVSRRKQEASTTEDKRTSETRRDISKTSPKSIHQTLPRIVAAGCNESRPAHSDSAVSEMRPACGSGKGDSKLSCCHGRSIMGDGKGAGNLEDVSASGRSTRSTAHSSSSELLCPILATRLESGAELSAAQPAEVYTFGRLLGKGNFGLVRECLEKRTGQRLACKFISKESLQARMSAVPSLLQEIQALQQLRDVPGVVRLHAVHEDRQWVYLVMELCNGGELFDLLVDRRDSLRKAQAAGSRPPKPSASGVTGGSGRAVAGGGGRRESRQAAQAAEEQQRRERANLKRLQRELPVLEEREAAFVMRQLLEAAAEFHSRGIVHRDLKPENVILCMKRQDATSSGDCGSRRNSNGQEQDGDAPSCKLSCKELKDLLVAKKSILSPESVAVKVADFGLSMRLQQGAVDITNAGCVGSPMYQAPEMVKGQRYGVKVDVWSLGVILFAMLTGCLPFIEKTRDKLKKVIARGHIDLSVHPWPLVSQEAKDLVHKLLNVDPRHRPSAAAVVNHPWMVKHCGLSLRDAPRPHAVAPSDDVCKGPARCKEEVEDCLSGSTASSGTARSSSGPSPNHRVGCPSQLSSDRSLTSLSDAGSSPAVAATMPKDVKQDGVHQGDDEEGENRPVGCWAGGNGGKRSGRRTYPVAGDWGNEDVGATTSAAILASGNGPCQSKRSSIAAYGSNTQEAQTRSGNDARVEETNSRVQMQSKDDEGLSTIATNNDARSANQEQSGCSSSTRTPNPSPRHLGLVRSKIFSLQCKLKEAYTRIMH